ncbi:unnamed protein product [Brugia timori]|uniref:Y1_Tnp domain-containing protein n=1 Tax=Brugia timori TaxID=42155 RepID=A0A0R3R5S2_9BILA|nr:unnamed protein product [Brugia timori]
MDDTVIEHQKCEICFGFMVVEHVHLLIIISNHAKRK